MGVDQGVTLQQFPSKAVEAYGQYEFSRLDRKLAMFRALPQEDRDLLPEFEKRMSAMADCIHVNARLLANMADSAEGIAPAARPLRVSPAGTATAVASDASPSAIPATAATTTLTLPTGVDSGSTNGPPDSDVNEAGGRDDGGDGDDAGVLEPVEERRELSRGVRRGFTLLATDWSDVGVAERARIYSPIVTAIDTAYEEACRAATSLQRESFRVLVPGAGAGRLAWELAHRGFSVEGCEDSFIALLVGNYIMNSVDVDAGEQLHPYVHEHSNVRSQASVIRSVRVPDVNPKDIPASAEFTMRAGRFVDAYDGQDNAWDAVASYLAFDVGEASLGHVRRVAQILKPGGVWVVAGPTPCVDGAQGDGVHVSGEEFVEMIRKCGFKLVKQETMKSLYSADESSLRTVHFECPFVVAIKVRPVV